MVKAFEFPQQGPRHNSEKNVTKFGIFERRCTLLAKERCIIFFSIFVVDPTSRTKLSVKILGLILNDVLACLLK